MHAKFSFLMLLSLTVFSTTFVQAAGQKKQADFEIDYATLNCIGDKVYFDHDHLILSDEGIFLLVNDYSGKKVEIMVSQLNFDSNGLFVLAEQIGRASGTCCNNHPIWHRECGGCGIMWCPARCKCFG